MGTRCPAYATMLADSPSLRVTLFFIISELTPNAEMLLLQSLVLLHVLGQ